MAAPRPRLLSAGHTHCPLTPAPRASSTTAPGPLQPPLLPPAPCSPHYSHQSPPDTLSSLRAALLTARIFLSLCLQRTQPLATGHNRLCSVHYFYYYYYCMTQAGMEAKAADLCSSPAWEGGRAEVCSLTPIQCHPPLFVRDLRVPAPWLLLLLALPPWWMVSSSRKAIIIPF